MRTASALVLAVACAAQAGCGSADEAFLTNYCTTVEACCVVNFFRAAPDIAGCRAQLAMIGFSRDPAVQSACLGELQDRAAAGAACFPSVTNLAGACVRLFNEPAGSKAPGELCTLAAECAGAPRLITLCVGRCLQLAYGKTGDACLGDMREDGVILAAPEFQPNTNQQIFTGAVCGRGAGLYCSSAPDPALRTCQPLGGNGADCNNNPMSCLSFSCGADLTCDPVVPDGQACGADPFGICGADSYCEPNGAATGICTPRMPEGSTCNDDVMCASGACATDGQCLTFPFWDLFGFCGRNF